MLGQCAFCGTEKDLRVSHVLPAFIYRWLRRRSGTGHIRHTENPNVRVQDGAKQPWLCQDCEALFSITETAFANKAFYAWHDGKHRILYGDWLLRFCVSVSWRVLKFARGKNVSHKYTDEQENLMNQAEVRWRNFLNGDVPHPGGFEQHLMITDIIESSTAPNLPDNFNRFMTGAVTFDIVGSQKSLMTFAKLGNFIVFGIVQKGSDKWEGTKVHVKHGVLQPTRTTVPIGILDLLRDKAQKAKDAMAQLSPAQRSKIDSHIHANLDAFLKSDQFASIQADMLMFGEDAVLWKNEDES